MLLPCYVTLAFPLEALLLARQPSTRPCATWSWQPCGASRRLLDLRGPSWLRPAPHAEASVQTIRPPHDSINLQFAQETHEPRYCQAHAQCYRERL